MVLAHSIPSLEHQHTLAAESLKAGRYHDALFRFSKLLEHEGLPARSQILCMRSEALNKLGRFAEAIVDAETALKLESDDIRKIKPLYRLACGLHASGNAGRAREVLLLAMAMVPTEEAAREFEDLFQQCEYTLRDQMPYVSIKDSRVQVKCSRRRLRPAQQPQLSEGSTVEPKLSCPAGSNSSSCGSAGAVDGGGGSTSEMPCNATATGSSSTSRFRRNNRQRTEGRHTATGAHSATSPEVEVEARRTVLRGWYGPDPDVVLQMIVWAISVWLAPLAWLLLYVAPVGTGTARATLPAGAVAVADRWGSVRAFFRLPSFNEFDDYSDDEATSDTMAGSRQFSLGDGTNQVGIGMELGGASRMLATELVALPSEDDVDGKGAGSVGMHVLPTELLQQILTPLSQLDLLPCRSVSKAWATEARNLLGQRSRLPEGTYLFTATWVSSQPLLEPAAPQPQSTRQQAAGSLTLCADGLDGDWSSVRGLLAKNEDVPDLASRQGHRHQTLSSHDEVLGCWLHDGCVRLSWTHRTMETGQEPEERIRHEMHLEDAQVSLASQTWTLTGVWSTHPSGVAEDAATPLASGAVRMRLTYLYGLREAELL